MNVVLNDADMRDLRLFLEAQTKDTRKILTRAINRALPGVRTDAKDEIAKVTPLKKSAMHKRMTLKKAWPDKITGLMDCTSRPIPLIDYGARQTKKGVTVQVLRSSSRSLIAHAFIATMKSGHKGVFWREEKDFARKQFSQKITYGSLPRKYRLPITERYGPRVSDFLANNKVMGKVIQKAGDRWDKAIEYEIDRFFTAQRGRFD